MSHVSRRRTPFYPVSGENFLYVFKGARSAPRAIWRVIPCRQHALAGEATVECARRAGAMRPRDSHRGRAGSSAFAPSAHGGLPPERYPGHCPSPAGRRHARRPRPRGEGPSSRRSSLEPTKITVKGGAYGAVTA